MPLGLLLVVLDFYGDTGTDDFLMYVTVLVGGPL